MAEWRHRHDSGFSMVELMTVLAILAILVAVAFASYSVTTEDSRRVSCVSNVRTIRALVLEYRVDRGRFPSDLETVRPLAQSRAIFARCVSTGDPYKYDPFIGEVGCPTPGHEVP